MTVYRHIPTKEDLVLVDQHGQLLAERVALVRWAEDDGRTDLPDMVTRALAAAFGPDL